jgi:hypothetical protein
MYKFLCERSKRGEVDIENRNVFRVPAKEAPSGLLTDVHEKSQAAEHDFC